MDSNTVTSAPSPEIDKGLGPANGKKPEGAISEEAAGNHDARPEIDQTAPGAAAIDEEAIRTRDVRQTKLLVEKLQMMMDEEINLLRTENQRLHKLELDDTWLDSWDAQIFRCTDCDRPFGTSTRLLDHRKTWHSAGSNKIEKYAKAGRNSKPVGIDELKEIFKSGDLILKTTTGDRSVGYVVSSQVLCMTSKVFLKMLGRDSPFKEAMDVRLASIFGFPPAVVTVDDDDKALEFIFKALHHLHDLIPKTLAFDELVRISEICDKYDFRLGVLKSTVENLLASYKSSLAGDANPTGSSSRDWLLVSYVFGYTDIFSKISKELVLTGSWTEDCLLFPDGGEGSPLSSCTPSSITDMLEKQRQETVDKIREHMERVQADRSSSWKCKGQANQKECEALVLGHLIKSIDQNRLNEDETWNQSLKSISVQLKGIADLTFPLTYYYNGGYQGRAAHTTCSWVPELHRIVDEALNKVEGLKLSDFPSSGHTTSVSGL